MNEVTTPDDAPVRFETKIAVLLRDDLAAWQRLNVTAFLASGVTAAHPELVGRPYADADGTGYLALLGQPVLVLEGTADLLRTAHRRAVERAVPLAVFTAGMFTTGHDAANRAVVAAVPGAQLDLVGLALHGSRGRVDKVVKGARMHP
ncbi:DUF2000 family protein [Kineococcus esterisolvens]|uniref:DUF2000 family protein n=1 Tax=unclassified Kineococcus TaxID=2621656 RepID=UPI003D7CC031